MVDLAGGVEVLVWTLARWRPRHNWLALFETDHGFSVDNDVLRRWVPWMAGQTWHVST